MSGSLDEDIVKDELSKSEGINEGINPSGSDPVIQNDEPPSADEEDIEEVKHHHHQQKKKHHHHIQQEIQPDDGQNMYQDPSDEGDDEMHDDIEDPQIIPNS